MMSAFMDPVRNLVEKLAFGVHTFMGWFPSGSFQQHLEIMKKNMIISK